MTEIPTASLWCGLAYALLVAGACFVIGFKMGAAQYKPLRDAKGKFIRR
jgi:hypothetical protein